MSKTNENLQERLQERLQEPNAQRVYDVTEADLPLHCPSDEMSLWNSHPRVYLPIEEQGGKVACPYCGAEYRLKD